MKPSPDIDDLLRNSKVPERPPAYWQEFPGRVTCRIEELEKNLEPIPEPPTWNFKPGIWNSVAWPSVAAACLIVGFFLGSWHGMNRPAAVNTMAEYRKVYREMARMFPNQVRAIVMDQNGIHLVLADKANVPASQPVLVKVATGGQTQRIITFSGQQVRLNGENCEVMTDAEGHVILVGKGWCWSSRETRKDAGHYEIEAEPLDAML